MKTIEDLKREMKSENYYAAWYAAKEIELRGVVLTDADFHGTHITRESLTPRDLSSWDRCCRSSGL